MDENAYRLLRRVRQDFMRLSDTLQALEKFHSNLSIELNKGNNSILVDITPSFYFWLPKAMVAYDSAIFKILKVTLFPDDTLKRSLTMNENFTEEQINEILDALGSGKTVLSSWV